MSLDFVRRRRVTVSAWLLSAALTLVAVGTALAGNGDTVFP